MQTNLEKNMIAGMGKGRAAEEAENKKNLLLEHVHLNRFHLPS